MIWRGPSQLSHLAREEARREWKYQEAEVMSVPQLTRSDGLSSTYACDVRILGQEDSVKNVPIASTAGEVVYAAQGSAVTVHRLPLTGKMEIVGFAKRKPGFLHRYSLDLSLGALGAVSDRTLTKRPLTYNELQSYGGGYGVIAYGAQATFRGATLVEVGL